MSMSKWEFGELSDDPDINEYVGQTMGTFF